MILKGGWWVGGGWNIGQHQFYSPLGLSQVSQLEPRVAKLSNALMVSSLFISQSFVGYYASNYNLRPLCFQSEDSEKQDKQAGAELCQAQDQLGLV